MRHFRGHNRTFEVKGSTTFSRVCGPRLSPSEIVAFEDVDAGGAYAKLDTHLKLNEYAGCPQICALAALFHVDIACIDEVTLADPQRGVVTCHCDLSERHLRVEAQSRGCRHAALHLRTHLWKL